MAETRELTAAEEDTLLTEIRERFDYATAELHDIRTEAKKDMRYVAGDPWEAADRAARVNAGRPCLSLDELGQYVNQVVNEVRANPRAVKFSPTGHGADDKTAEFYSNKTREIEYRSKAQMVYTTAFENAVQRGYGFCRINTRFEHPRSFNQEIWLEPIVNPDLVTPDPDALQPDGSDMKYCFIHESRSVAEFKREFPNAKIHDFTGEVGKAAPAWVKDNRIQIAEYWKVKTRTRKLLLLRPPPPTQSDQPAMPPLEIFEDELEAKPTADQILRTEEREWPEVCQYLTNGVEILKTTEWAGKYIPIACCYGKVLYLDEGAGVKRKLMSMVRLARDPYMLYCYYRTCEAELVGMTPKTPFIGYKGQFRGHERDWQRANHEPVAYLEAEPFTEASGQNVLLPLPQRQPYEPPIQALEVGAEAARRAIQAAMGTSFLPTQAQRRNEKSGKALQQIEDTAQKGSFHFVDHYNDMIQHVGVMVEDLIDKIYDAPRETGIRKDDESSEVVRINDPQDKRSYPTKGDHLVTISAGPSYDSQREEASSFVETLAGLPEVFPLIASEAVKLKQLGPIGDRIAKILEFLKPPEIRAMLEQEKQGSDPERAVKELAQTKAQLAQVMQVAEQMKKDLETDAAKQQATIAKAEIDAKLAIELQHIKNAATIRVAEIAAQVKGLQIDHDHEHELQALGVDVTEAAKDRQHETEMAERQHEQALEQGEQATDAKLRVGDQQVAGKLAVEKAKPKPKPNGSGASA